MSPASPVRPCGSGPDGLARGLPDENPVTDLAVAVAVVRVATAPLREPSGDQVADRENRGVPPDLPGAEAAGIRRVDDGAGDEHASENGDERKELRGLGAALVSVPNRRPVVRSAAAPFMSRSATPPRVDAEVLM
jgi:hypothetical protein